MNQDLTLPALPWWRAPAAWLVVGGPAIVVVASVATLAIAVRGGDVPLRTAPEVAAPSMTPATQARNHAAAPRR
ncbi:nitrogen fixation protein FixH [Piscinibacter sp. XHJ-5]|uniref:nitrogen fixation protein FixH n=1 Tax=Piscinibacter sp. XHJ-5 TaxID=3037797 RepID=UPI002452B8CA|nr:nitrogen fixation protein FixH [Piscinibacter sp. XHJ-5]